MFIGAVLYTFTPFDYAVYISTFTGLVQFGLYYLSRFKNKLNLAIALSIINISFTRVGGYIL